ncbi:MAG: sigma 54-interacting transcriptional regulator [Desulfovibrio sp.]|uniref:sigma 54-interacting transcriptional regulator n=1 Tax=Desulfovibrio sp. 7SRBS1 TaxID=3378064 RepID=UPI003B3FD41B
MSERILELSLEMFKQPVLILDKDGGIVDANKAGRSLAGGFTGKHVARFSMEVGDVLTVFRIKGEVPSGTLVRINDVGHLIQVYPLKSVGFVVMLQPLGRDLEQEKTFRFFKQAFDNATDGIWVADADARVCALNKASERLNGVRARQVVGRFIHDVLAEGLLDRSVTMEVLERKRQVSFVQHVIPVGKYLHVTGTPHYDENGEIEFVVVNERDVTDLKNMRSSMEETRMARDKARELLTEISLKNEDESELIAASPKMRLVADMGLKFARLEAQCILISGETGVGRHSLAQYIHRCGVHSGGPFMNINCAALPPALQDAELFGCVAGAVPGTSGKARAGILSLAEKGTLMLDDVGALTMQTQAKLLRCMDDGSFTTVGGRKEKKLDCFLLVTSHSGLENQVSRGLFREDLYRRLAMFTLHVPPLRERAEDIPSLAELFLERANAILQTRLEMTPYCLTLLGRQEYPGNTHDLEALIMKAAALSDGGDFEVALDTVLASPEERPLQPDKCLLTLQERLDDVERDALAQAREVCRTTREMGKLLGISQAGVVRKLRKYGLEAPLK